MTARLAVELPTLGFDMDAGRLIAWLKQVGEDVREGEGIAEIETEKATVELESPHTGRLVEHCVAEGDEVPVGTVIAYLDGDG